MSFQALAREINNPPSSVPQFLEPLLAKGKVIRIKRGIYALHGRAPAYIPTSDAIISALSKNPMKLGPLVQHVIEFTKGTRSRSSIRTVLSRFKRLGTVKQEQRYGEYRLTTRVRPVRRGDEGHSGMDLSQRDVRHPHDTYLVRDETDTQARGAVGQAA